MQAITTTVKDPTTRDAVLLLHGLVDAVTHLFNTADPAAVQTNAASVMHSLLVALPGNPVWQQHAASLVPMLRSFSQELQRAGALAAAHPDRATHLAGRLYDRATSIVVSAVELMAPEDAMQFNQAYLKARGVL